MYHNVPDDEILVNLYEKGLNSEKIVEALRGKHPGLTKAFVQQRLRANHVVMRHGQPLTPPATPEMVADYNRGLSIRQVGDKYRIPEQTMYKRLQRARVAFRSPAVRISGDVIAVARKTDPWRVPRAEFPTPLTNAIVDLWEMHGDVDKVADMCKISPEAVRARLQREGIEVVATDSP